MIKEYFDNLVAGIETKLSQDPSSRTPTKVYALEVAKLAKRLYSGQATVAWTGITAPFEILSAMGVTSCFVEFIGATLASAGMSGALIQEADEYGFAGDMCSYHRAVMGAARKNMMPIPDLLIGLTCPCSGGLAVIENLAHFYNKALFIINVPQQDTAPEVAYLSAQIRKMVDFVQEHTRQPFDPDQLKQAVEKANETSEWMRHVYEMAMRQPTPINSKMLSNVGIVMGLFWGTDAGITIAKAYYDELTARLNTGKNGVPGERLRLLWIQNRIQFKNPILDLLEKDYGAVIVSDELNDITWAPIDPDDPFTGIAKRIISNPFNGPIHSRIHHLQKLCKQYQVDGAINPCNWGCRQGAGARGLITEGLKDIGVPVLNLEVDCVDQRNFAEGQLKNRIEAFIEMLNR